MAKEKGTKNYFKRRKTKVNGFNVTSCNGVNVLEKKLDFKWKYFHCGQCLFDDERYGVVRRNILNSISKCSRNAIVVIDKCRLSIYASEIFNIEDISTEANKVISYFAENQEQSKIRRIVKV